LTTAQQRLRAQPAAKATADCRCWSAARRASDQGPLLEPWLGRCHESLRHMLHTAAAHTPCKHRRVRRNNGSALMHT
jgi:hypothetical protein